MFGIKTTALTAILLITLSACGGGGSSSSSSSETVTTDGDTDTTTSTGIFVDNVVINLGYRTDTQSGYTNERGEFNYLPGETIVFFIGDLEFPPVLASSVITPLDIANTDDAGSDTVLNIIRLLQSIDQDNNPSNGITIGQQAIDAATQVDFSLEWEIFEAALEVTTLLMNAGQLSAVTEMTPCEVALEHFTSTLDTYGINYNNTYIPHVISNDFYGTWSGFLDVNWSDTDQEVRVTFNENSTEGYNVPGDCHADFLLLEFSDNVAIYEVDLQSGPCIPDALLEFTLGSSNTLQLNMYYLGAIDSISQDTLIATADMTRSE
ncbi:MAG: hypothetical protein KUF72_11455 [Candidatus Thiodiazotropha sp. (ex Ctena orbiculata)]|nr:hypothetical protein [Candidatus Thiodiazotropha taylori]